MAHEEIGKKFIEFYYTLYDTPNRKLELAQLYHDSAILHFEDDQQIGKNNIMEKHLKFTAQTVHAITKIDCLPTLDDGVLVAVLGQVKTDDDKPMGYSHVFVLKGLNNTFYIVNEVFRLVLHNF